MQASFLHLPSAVKGAASLMLSSLSRSGGATATAAAAAGGSGGGGSGGGGGGAPLRTSLPRTAAWEGSSVRPASPAATARAQEKAVAVRKGHETSVVI
jgi:hypothetical protein